jgi:protein-tyrosine phosphatase
MIDLHCHILPGVDDGPESLEESLEMCRIAAADGIRTVVATPHFRPGTYDCGNAKGHVDRLQRELAARGIDLRLVPGADVSVTPELVYHVEEDKGLTINGKGSHVLVELPHEAVPLGWDRFLLSLREKNITPILTHPERNRWFVDRPDALYAFVMGGGLVQVTAMSVTGENGAEIRRYSRSLLQRNLVHIIASDAHSSTLRMPVLSNAVAAATDVIGREAALKLVREHPMTIIEGKSLDLTERVVMLPRKRAWFRKVLDM